mmetsp:Transcript_102236/g.181541  ORF Transcript_102236/g.181541 Transcript_102236/m.181541 type:complete len:487 (+) Transcript_102236:42-1502(+)
MTTGYPVTGAIETKKELPADGWSAPEVFSQRTNALSLDDIVFLPGENTGNPANLAGRISKNVNVKSPIVAGFSPMSSGDSMAISFALLGGVGVIHRHQSLKDQSAQLRKVKQHECGFILNPTCLGMQSTVADAQRIQDEFGCSGIPITQNGKMGGKLVGLITKRDLEDQDRKTPLTSLMTTDLVLTREPVTLKDACDLMSQSKVAKLPVVNRDNELVALICRGDLKRSLKYPEASRDANRQLMVAASLSARGEGAWERAKALVEAGADILCLDVDDGVDGVVIAFLKHLKEQFAGIDVIAGKVNSQAQAMALAEAGADCIRVGDCYGAEATTIYDLAKFLRTNYGVPLMADGIRDSGQMFKALLLGSTAVCLDAMVASCEEAPGDHIYREGVRVKLDKSPTGPRLVEPGKASGLVAKGTARTYVAFILKKVEMAFQELGISSMLQNSKFVEEGVVRMERQLPPPASAYLEAPKLYPAVVGSLHMSR